MEPDPGAVPPIPAAHHGGVVSVLVFPDMEPDPALTRALADSAVHVVFGVQDFTGQLAGLADIKKAPKADEVHHRRT